MLEVSVEQTLLSEFILRSVSGGVTPSTIPYITDEFLAKVHRTPSVTCGAPLAELIPFPWREPPVSPLAWITEGHDTYILLMDLVIH